MITPIQEERIAIEVINALYCQSKEIAEVVNPNQKRIYSRVFLESLVDSWFGEINLSSWTRGLNTSLGHSFFENVAHILSGGTKRDFTVRGGIALVVGAISRVKSNKQYD